MTEAPFAHLAVRSSYSLRDGAIRPRELAAAAAEAGMTHVGLTDRDGVYGAVRFARACTREGVTPVIGADLALEPDLTRPGWGITRAGRHRLPTRGTEDPPRSEPDPDPKQLMLRQRGAGSGSRSGRGDGPDAERLRSRQRGAGAGPRSEDPRRSRPGEGPGWLEDDAPRVTLFADDGGYGDLCRAVSATHRDARSSPHLGWKDAAHHAGRLVALLGADSPAGRLVAQGRPDAAADEVARWAEVFGPENVVIGVRHHLARGDDRRAGAMVALADRLGLVAAATNDVRYLRPQDAPLADVLACVRGQVPLDRAHIGRTTAEGWLKTAEDLAAIPLFRDRPDLLAGAQAVAERCATDLQLHTGPRAPHLTGLDDVEAARELRARCEAGLTDRYPQVTAEVRERLAAELTMIDRLGLHDYFLAVADIVVAIREMRVICACRGSAAGSLVCYLLRISDVDPVGNGLLFERFMNPHRDELPDIDIDVESARREDVYRMIVDRYGEHRTACVAMVETFQARMGVREVGKVLGLPEAEIDLVAKAFRRVRARDVRAALRELPELADSRLDAGQLDTLLQVVERIDGFPRHLALHPCGIVLADDDLLDRTPVERSANGFSMTQFDKDDVAALGLLKLDVLAVRMLSAARHALDLLPGTRGEELDFEEVPAEDPSTYEMLRTTESIGVFQVESPGQQELLGRLQPEHFGDLITEISLFRPGPVKADMVGPYVARRRGEEEPRYRHPRLEPVLGETYGVVVYHEQVMGVVAALTGCDLSHADLVRRELADPRRLPALRTWALTRARDRGFDRRTAEEIWAQVESFASFGFCKAHAAAFAVPTYRSAWLKRHRLPEFTAGLLTHDPGMFPRRLILHEARRNGIEVRGPDVNVSQGAYTVEGGGGGPAVRIGLQDVKGMSEAERTRLLAHRPYTTVEDLRRRGGISAPTAEALVRAGALDTVAGIEPMERRGLLLEVSERWSRAGRRRDTGGPEQTRLDLAEAHRPRLPAASLADVVRDELAVLGLDVTRHVVSFYEPLLDLLGVVRAGGLHAPDAPSDGERIRVGGVRVALQSPPVRSGQRVLFLSLDDRTGMVQCNFFARSLETEAWTVLNARLVVVEGRLRRSGVRGATVIAARAWDVSRLWRAWCDGGLERELRRRGAPPPAERSRSGPVGLHAAMFAQGSRS